MNAQEFDKGNKVSLNFNFLAFRERFSGRKSRTLAGLNRSLNKLAWFFCMSRLGSVKASKTGGNILHNDSQNRDAKVGVSRIKPPNGKPNAGTSKSEGKVSSTFKFSSEVIFLI